MRIWFGCIGPFVRNHWIHFWRERGREEEAEQRKSKRGTPRHAMHNSTTGKEREEERERERGKLAASSATGRTISFVMQRCFRFTWLWKRQEGNGPIDLRRTKFASQESISIFCSQKLFLFLPPPQAQIYLRHTQAQYRASHPVCRKVVKIMFWEISPADCLALNLPTAQAGPRNSHGKT